MDHVRPFCFHRFLANDHVLTVKENDTGSGFIALGVGKGYWASEVIQPTDAGKGRA